MTARKEWVPGFSSALPGPSHPGLGTSGLLSFISCRMGVIRHLPGWREVKQDDSQGALRAAPGT